jgi:hypothetical protein
MIDDAFPVLEHLRRSEMRPDATLDGWADAFVAISWVVRTDHGLVLTPAGHQACDEFARQRRRSDPVGSPPSHGRRDSPRAEIPRG